MQPKEIRTMRLHLGLTVSEFAELLGVDAATVARWEIGSTSTSDDEQERLRTFVAVVTGLPVTAT